MPRGIPSQSQLRSQMRSAVRNAERDLRRQLASAQRKAEAEASRELKKWERETNRKLRAARPSVTYTPIERQYLGDVQREAERQAIRHPERRDVFLCHAWDDRTGAALEFYNYLNEFGVDVWFSETDVQLGTSLIREIDRGLKMSRIGVVLVTPNMLSSLASEGIADKELSALLATDRVIPVVHQTNFERLRDESPLLASRSGLDTGGSSLRDVAVKIANSVRPEES